MIKQTLLRSILLSLFLFLTACSGGGEDQEETVVCTNGGTDYPTCTAPVCANGGTDYPTCTAPVCANGGTDYPTCTAPVCANGGTDYPTCTAPVCTNGGTDYPTCTAPVCANGGTDYPTCTLPFCAIAGIEHPDCVDASLPEFLVESDFFNDTSSSIPVERQMTLVNEPGDDSSNLQTLINQLNAQGGGNITLPASPDPEWVLGEIKLASNVHIFVEPAVVIKPKRFTYNGPLFHLGYDGGPYIRNVSIRSSSATEQFTIDMSDLSDDLYILDEEPPRLVPFSVKHVENFMLSGVYVIDKGTVHSSVNLVPSKTDGIWAGASNGLVKDITVINAHGGYGAVQVRVGENVFFKNIESLGGGATLRIETDAVSASGGQAPLEISKIADIFGYNIKCKNGNAAVMIQPWGATNGRFDVQKIAADSCGAAVRIDRAFVDWQTSSGQFTNPDNLPVGSFSADSRITDVTTIYGTNAQVKQGTLPFVPCELRYLWLADAIPYMETFHQGPSISPLLYAASSTTIDDPRFYSIMVPSEQELREKSTGFPSASKTISRDNEKLFACD